MEEKKISYKEQVENIFPNVEISPEKKQTVSPPLLPSYSKSYSETQIEWTTFEYIWKINEFGRLYKTLDTLRSPSFPETAEYIIEMDVSRNSDLSTILKFYLHTTKAFTGSCTTTILMHGCHVSSRSISGCISNITLLFEGPSSIFKNYTSDRLCTIHCEFKIFHELISNTIHMNLQAFSTVFSKHMKSLEDSTLDEFDGTSIKFIVGKNQYSISKKLLLATNSSYFKNICFTHEGNEKDMTNELTEIELRLFGFMLIFIKTGSIESDYYNDLKELLITADEYDVLTLKLTCEHYLLRIIAVWNAVELIQLAFRHNAECLKKHSASFIKLFIKEIMNTKEFEDLSQTSSNKIMELINKTNVFEISTNRFCSSSARIT